MTQSTSLSTKLIAAGNQGKKAVTSPKAPPSNIVRALMHYPDQMEAAQLIGEHAGLEFDTQHGGKIQQLRHETEDLDARYEVSSARLTLLEQKVANTKQYVKACVHYGQGPQDEDTQDET